MDLGLAGKTALVTGGSKGIGRAVAQTLAEGMVEARLAACVNVLPGVVSLYRWKGRVCSDGEFLLLIKTRAKEFAGVRETILKLNTYELPEVLAYRVDEASPAFADWIAKTTAHKKRAKPRPARKAIRKKR